MRVKSSLASSWILAGLSLLLAQPGRAHFPALYGKHFVLARNHEQNLTLVRAPSTRSSGVAASTADVAPSAADFPIGAYEELLRQQEQLHGPFSATLTDPLSRLGQYYRERGEYAAALSLLERALHLLRVNDGLHSLRQLPLLRQQMEIFRLTGDAQRLNLAYQSLFQLHGSGRPPFTAAGMAANLEYLGWQREVHELDLDGGNPARLLELYQLNERMLESLAEPTPEQRQWRVQLVHSQLYNLYRILGEELSRQPPLSVHSSSELFDQQLDSEGYVQRRLAALQSHGIDRGSSLLQSLLDDPAGLPVVERARLHLELGDWYQWNAALQKASREYLQVANLLQQAGEVKLREQWLGAPVELPANDAFAQSLPPAAGEGVPVNAQFSVSAKGYARNIHVHSNKPEGKQAVRRIRRMLVETHFRPRFASGQAERVAQVNRVYRLVD